MADEDYVICLNCRRNHRIYESSVVESKCIGLKVYEDSVLQELETWRWTDCNRHSGYCSRAPR